MEKSRRIAIIENQTLSKTQEKKRRRRKYPNVFFKKEIIAVFDKINNPRTMIASFLAFFCALRISEVCKLEWIDINLDEARLKVVDGKNHKDGFIPISPLAIPILKRWKAMNPNEKYLLPTDRFGTPFYQSSSLLKDFKRALVLADLDIPTEKNAEGRQQHQYKFHTLRHSRCTHLLSNGVPVEKVQKFMRHDDLETTMTYTWIMDKEMNKMVKEADMNTFAFDIQETNQQNLHVVQQAKINPTEILQKRLVSGEITIREYNKLSKALLNIK